MRRSRKSRVQPGFSVSNGLICGTAPRAARCARLSVSAILTRVFERIGMTRPLLGLLSRAALAAIMLAGSNLLLRADEWRTSSSLMGSSKYGEDFQHYDYVNPAAPKGGTLNSVASGTFDSFNPYIVQGSPAAGFAAIRRRPDLRHADGAGDRRGERQPSADRRRLQISRRLFVRDLPHRSASKMA